MRAIQGSRVRGKPILSGIRLKSQRLLNLQWSGFYTLDCIEAFVLLKCATSLFDVEKLHRNLLKCKIKACPGCDAFIFCVWQGKDNTMIFFVRNGLQWRI